MTFLVLYYILGEYGVEIHFIFYKWVNYVSQFLFFLLNFSLRISFYSDCCYRRPCVVVVNMDGKPSEAADTVKREVQL